MCIFFNDNEKDVRFILCFGKHTSCYVLAWKALIVYVCVCVSVCVQDAGSTNKYEMEGHLLCAVLGSAQSARDNNHIGKGIQPGFGEDVQRRFSDLSYET